MHDWYEQYVLSAESLNYFPDKPVYKMPGSPDIIFIRCTEQKIAPVMQILRRWIDWGPILCKPGPCHCRCTWPCLSLCWSRGPGSRCYRLSEQGSGAVRRTPENQEQPVWQSRYYCSPSCCVGTWLWTQNCGRRGLPCDTLAPVDEWSV